MKKIFVIVFIFLFIGLLYKIYLVNKYYVDEVPFNNDNFLKETIIINHKDYEGKMYKDEDLMIKDDFSDWELKNDFYIFYNKNKDVEKAVSISKTNQYFKELLSRSFIISDNDDDNLFTEKDRDKFNEENNIYSDVDLLKYVKENYYLKNSIFDSIKTLKEKYIINSFVSVAFPTNEEEYRNLTTLIDGDVLGYINSINANIKEIHILYNHKQYIITLAGKEITTDEYIKTLLESIKYDKVHV